MAMKYFGHIDEYVDGVMSEEEKTLFEQEMNKNPELKEQVDLKQAERDLIKQHISIRETRAYLDNLDAKKGTIIRIRPVLAIAATIVGLLIIAYFVIDYRYSYQALAGRYYFEPYTEEVRNDQAPKEVVLINQYWNDQNWDGLIQSVNQIESNLEFYPYARFMQAHAYYKQDQLVEAVSIFNEIAMDEEHANRENAEWQLVLIALKENHKSEINRLLEIINSEPSHTYYEQALKLQKELNSGIRKILF